MPVYFLNNPFCLFVSQISEVLKKTLSASSTHMLDVNNSTLSLDVVADVVPDVSPRVKFESLQYSLFTTNFVEVLGGLFFLMTALYIIKDRREAERVATGKFSWHPHIL